MYDKSLLLVTCCLLYHFGEQLCPEELTTNGIRVIWHQSSAGSIIRSNPPCYNNYNEVKRTCLNDKWAPSANELIPCDYNVDLSVLSACPPGFNYISKNVKEYCYKIDTPLSWDYPCLKGGGATVITDFTDNDIVSLLDSLQSNNISQYYWLPAKRQRIFTPMMWYVSGPKWGHPVVSNNMLSIQTSIFKNCLLLDIVSKKISAETCSAKYPSLCFYVNSVYYPGKCPKNYHAIRYKPDHGVCFGIEYSKTELQFDDFVRDQCKIPIGYAPQEYRDITRFIFKKIAETDQLSDKSWCWFDKKPVSESSNKIGYVISKDSNDSNSLNNAIYTAINNIGTLSVFDSTPLVQLSCMACQTEIIYERTELMFEYSENDNMMLLTIYYPSGLWKYDTTDRGIQCFSDAKGFVQVIDIQDSSIVENIRSLDSTENSTIEKITYQVNLVANRSAQYWCEGHTKNFSLITTDRIVVNPKGSDVHVFSLVLKVHIVSNISQNNLNIFLGQVCSNVQHIFEAETVLWMDVLDYTSDHLMVLLHVHVATKKFNVDKNKYVVSLYEILKSIAQTELVKYNYIFINITSSVYCLPTTSRDNSIHLDWELTPIGHIAAPTQFCLQENGLPVRRLCDGSYLLGGFWDEVEGSCDKNYVPSTKTKFLYMFVKGQVPKNNITRFLIDGLQFALNNTDIIIPADIYYLSMALQRVLFLIQINESAIDLGDIANIARAMNNIMVLNDNYLRLAQTLNSTNVIVDTTNKLIEIIALKSQTIPTARNNNDRTNYYKSSLEQAVEPQFIVQISYPKINNISGIAVRKKSHSDKFTDMEIIPLYKNTSLNYVFSINDLEIATWLPDTVIDSLKKSNNQSVNEQINDADVCVILNVFHSNSVFQDLNTRKFKVNSRIVGISLPGYISNLRSSIPLIYRDISKISRSSKDCGYWEFNIDKESNIPGYWSNKGCYLKKSPKNLTLCECYHLTHFGQLLNIGKLKNPNDHLYNQRHLKYLNIISLVGSFLSLIGIVGIWITASLFHKWRKKAGTKLLLHLSVSIALPLILLVVVNFGRTAFKDSIEITRPERFHIACIVFGAFLHYSVLASFGWMLITAVLQFARYVRVLGVCRPSRFMIKFTLIGWGIPLLPVLIVLGINKNNYVPDLISIKDEYYSICYPTGMYFVFGVVVPVCVILFVNIILYILVIWAISKGPDGKLRSTDIDLLGAQFRLSIFLFFLLGLTWVFGVFSFSDNYIWSYLFCLTSTLQGFVLFIYFIIFDPDTRNMWWSLMKPDPRSTKPRESITSISSG